MSDSATEQIQAYNQGRDAERLALKYQKMRTSSFVFLRGTCHLFYHRLPFQGLYREAPLTWSCGDLHLENFGSYKGDNRLAYFDINDFDEAALAPCTWDLVRFLTSVCLGMAHTSQGTGHWGTEPQGLGRIFLQAYSQALALGKARWIEKETAEGPVQTLLAGLATRKRVDFLDSRAPLKGSHRRLRLDNGKALPVTEQARAMLEQFMQDYASRQSHPERFALKDVARRIAGTGSLGVDRSILLVEGKGSPDGNYLLDLKCALPSALTLANKVPQPAWCTEATRVVSLQYRLQAVSMAFLQAVTIAGESYILRGLQPSEDRVVLPRDHGERAARESLMRSCGQITAWAHWRGVGRQGSALGDDLVAFGQRNDWQEDLLGLGQQCAQQTEEDWREFCASSLGS